MAAWRGNWQGMLLSEGEQVMAMVVMQTSGTGIRTILISMILKPFLYVVAVISGAQTAGNGVDGKNIGGFPQFFSELASTFHVAKRHILWKKPKLCDQTTNLWGFAYLREAGEFSWLMGICTD